MSNKIMSILIRDKEKFHKDIENNYLLDEITDNPLDQQKLRLELDDNTFIIHVLPNEETWKFTRVVFHNINLKDIIEDNDIEKIIIRCQLPVEVRFQTDLDYYDYKDFPIIYEGPKKMMIFSKTGKLFKFR